VYDERNNRGGQKKQRYWTSYLIKQLRGKCTQAAFGALLGAPKNTVWRWESSQESPDTRYATRLSELAKREHFLSDWQASQLSRKVLQAFHAFSRAEVLIYVPVFVLWGIAMLIKVGRIALREP
jgi:hypothetical protein